MLTVEDPQRGDHAASLVAFCDALTVVLALRYAAVAAPAPVVSRAAATVTAGCRRSHPVRELSRQRQSRLEQTLMQQNTSLDELGESAIDQAAIGVLKLPDWTTVAQRCPTVTRPRRWTPSSTNCASSSKKAE